MRRGDRATRDQPAAAHRDEKIVELARILDQLLGRRALTRDHLRIVERRDHGETPLAYDPLGHFLTGLLTLVVEHDLGAVAAGGLDLDGGSVRGHHDGDADAEKLPRKSHGLRVVARGEGQHAALALRRCELRERVERAAELESADALQVLALEEDFGAGALVYRARGEHRRAVR